MCSRSTGYCTEHVRTGEWWRPVDEQHVRAVVGQVVEHARTGELWSQVDEERVCAVVAQVVEQVRGGRLTHRQLPLVE